LDWWMVFAVFLYFACAGLIVAEVFVPSGGLISVLALGCLAWGVVIFFNYGPNYGFAGIIVALIMIPTVLIGAYKVFPKTKFGRAVTLEPPKRDRGDAIPDNDELAGLLGKKGVVISPLRPVGMCDFDGRRVECIADVGYVEKGVEIKVIKVEGSQLTVRENNKS